MNSKAIQRLGVRNYYSKRKPFEHPFRYGYGMLDPWANSKFTSKVFIFGVLPLVLFVRRKCETLSKISSLV